MAELSPKTDAAGCEHEREYVLGTGDVEVRRLGDQHGAWLPIVRDCWNRAGIAAGHRVIDLGAGPGHAAFDLAAMVGPSGSVTAVERSTRFVSAGLREAGRRGLDNITFVEQDLMSDPLPTGPFDRAWCRWVCSFISSPESLIRGIADVMRPGGIAVFHEYVDYASWRFSPRLPLVEEYIRRVMHSWRADGGEPDIAMSLLPLLREHGFSIREAHPRVYCVSPDDPLWTAWISPFVRTNLRRLRELGEADAVWQNAVLTEFLNAESDPTTLMLTPAVLEIIAEYS